MQKLPNQQTEHIHEGMPSMPDSLAKDAAKYAQKGVFEDLQNNPRCGGNAEAYSGDTRVIYEQLFSCYGLTI